MGNIKPMEDITSNAWRRVGSSVIWSPALLGPLVLSGEAVPLRVALGWMKQGFPQSPPGGHATVLVAG